MFVIKIILLIENNQKLYKDILHIYTQVNNHF